MKVPHGHIWVEGDHHGHSFDSNAFGPVSQFSVYHLHFATEKQCMSPGSFVQHSKYELIVIVFLLFLSELLDFVKYLGQWRLSLLLTIIKRIKTPFIPPHGRRSGRDFKFGGMYWRSSQRASQLPVADRCSLRTCCQLM